MLYMNKDRLKASGFRLKISCITEQWEIVLLKRLLFCCTTALLLYLQGCVTVTSDYDALKSDVNMLKKDIYETKVSLQELKKQVDEIALIARQGGTEQAKALTESQLTLFNKLNAITAELTELRARFEEQRHFVEKNLNELKQADKRGQSKIENIEITVRDLEKRIDGLENQIKAFKPAFTPPTVSQSTEQRELPSAGSAASGTPQTVQTTRPAAPSQTQATAQPESPPKGTDEPKLLYDRARGLFKEKRYGEARALFEEFIKRYPDYRLAGNCRFWIAESYYAEKNYEDAILNYEKVIKDYPSNEKVPSAYLKQAYAFIELGDNKTGKVILQKLIEKYPGSEEAKAAKEKLAEMARKKR